MEMEGEGEVEGLARRRPGENGFYAGTRLHIALFMAFCAELTQRKTWKRRACTVHGPWLGQAALGFA